MKKTLLITDKAKVYKRQSHAMGFFGLVAVSLLALQPECAMALVGPTSLANITPAQIALLTSTDVPKLIEIKSWVMILRSVMIVFGSGIAIGAFMMFGANAEKPNPMGFWVGMVIGILTIVGGFFWVNDIILMALKQMFG